MREFEPVMKKSNSSQTLVELCSALGVELDKLTDVGTLYLQSKHPADRLLGRNLLLSASRAGSLAATIFLVYSAHSQQSLNAAELVKPRIHLKSSVQAGTTNVQALVLQGILYRDRKLYKEAASCFEKAIALAGRKDTDDSRFVKFLRWIGLDIGFQDPNLDKRRPQDLALDQVEAHIQLATLQNNHQIGGEGSENLKIAALEYDDPRAYYMLASVNDQYSYEWLQYMMKAAASGYGSAMEEIADLLGFSEEELKKLVPDQRVQDWVLESPVHWPRLGDHFHWPGSSYFSGCTYQDIPHRLTRYRWAVRTLRRCDWAVKWHEAASVRAQKNSRLDNFNYAMLYWRMADILEEIKRPLHLVRYYRASSLANARHLERSRKVDKELKKFSEVEFRLFEQHHMYREAAEILDRWMAEGPRVEASMNISWLLGMLRSIDRVPAGTWRWNRKRVQSNVGR
ncbi:hypothetical protein Vi05172_g8451 [Venturia inaequalis]|nr:hypothetical protein EG327_000711 [Venturia inaequalis]RDI81673.1 hypothetical protein Vi05172_g8451 [Venturia inaequalis]